MEKSKLKKLKNLNLMSVAFEICNNVTLSGIEEEINHPLFLKLEQMLDDFTEGYNKKFRSKYDKQVMEAEVALKKCYRGIFQHVASKASSLDPATADAAKRFLKKLKVTASAFERLKQTEKDEAFQHLLNLLHHDEFSRKGLLMVTEEMLRQIETTLDEFRSLCLKRDLDRQHLREITTASDLRTPLIEAISKYYLHLYLDSETNKQSLHLMGLLDISIEHGTPRKYTFRIRKPAQPKAKKKKGKKQV